MQMEVIHSRDNQTIVEIFTGNAAKLLWKLWIDTDCQAILADEISVFKAGQMLWICAETYSASECKGGWISGHKSYLLFAEIIRQQAKKIPNIFARRVTVTSNTYRQLLR